MLEEGCLLILRGRKHQPVPTLCVCTSSGVERAPNFQGAAARYPSAWKGCKILMEVDENGDVVELLISKMKLMLLRMLTITPKMITLRKQGTSLLQVMESSKESP